MKGRLEYGYQAACSRNSQLQEAFLCPSVTGIPGLQHGVLRTDVESTTMYQGMILKPCGYGDQRMPRWILSQPVAIESLDNLRSEPRSRQQPSPIKEDWTARHGARGRIHSFFLPTTPVAYVMSTMSALRSRHEAPGLNSVFCPRPNRPPKTEPHRQLFQRQHPLSPNHLPIPRSKLIDRKSQDAFGRRSQM